MSEKYTKGKIRDFEMTEKDAARLADCFNSFDDSDSWPGGFTGGTPYTAQRVLERIERTDNIRVIVAIDGSKIIGHCNVAHAERDREGAYVGLIGVRPDYQGKGYGKAMLIAATETAAESGKRRIDLHTWAGNLKAMPLYKRIGFVWVPNSRVLMESYVPGIITTPLFEEFFERYYWYDALKQEITQAPNEMIMEGIGVYEYHFEGENDDRLDVTIDRMAKGICGFTLTVDGKTISAKVLPKSQVGYIAIGEVPVRLNVKNDTGEKMHVSVITKPSDKLMLSVEDATQLDIQPGEEADLSGVYRIRPGAKPHSVTEPYVKVSTLCQWTLRFGDKTIDMFSGLIPQSAISLSTGPEYITVSPTERAEVSLEVTNNTQETIKGHIVLTEPGSHNLSWHMFSFELEPRRSTRKQLDVETLKDDENSVITIRTTTYIEGEETTRIGETSIPIPVLGPRGAVAYQSCSNRAVLETAEFRAEFSEGPLPVIETFEYKTLDKTVTGWFFEPQLGYPFSEGADWTNREYQPTYINSGDTAELVFEGESRERPGLRLQFIYRMHGENSELEFLVRFENIGTRQFQNLGFKTGNWTNTPVTSLYVPLREKIYRLSDIYWGSGLQLPDKPENYHETWYAVTEDEANCLFGVIWDRENMVHIKPTRGIRPPRFEYKIPDLKPGGNIEKRMLRLYFTTGTWKKIRAVWASLHGEYATLTEPNEYPSALEVTLTPSSGWGHTSGSSVVLVDGAVEDKLKFRTEVVHDDPIIGTARITPPPGMLLDGEKELKLDLEISIDRPFEREMTATIDDKGWFLDNGEIVLEFPNRIERRPLSVVHHDSSATVERTVEKHGKFTLYTLQCGGYRLSVSPEHAGGLVAYGPVGAPSVFYDTFPELKPFAWFDIMHSGVVPYVAGHRIWDWESSLRKESWSLEEVDRGPFSGYRVSTVLQHVENAQGVSISYDYLLLRGTPLVNVTMTVENMSDRWKHFSAGLMGTPVAGMNEKDRFHFIRSGKRVLYETTPNSIIVVPDAAAGWFVFERPNGEVFGMASTCKTRKTIMVIHMGEMGNRFILDDRFRLKSGQRETRSWWFLHGNDVEESIHIKDLPQLQL